MRRIHQECRHGSFEAARFASVAVLTVDCRKNVQVSVAKLLAVVFAQAAFFALNTNGCHGSVFTCRLISSSCARAIEAFGKCSLLRPQTDFFFENKLRQQLVEQFSAPAILASVQNWQLELFIGRDFELRAHQLLGLFFMFLCY